MRERANFFQLSEPVVLDRYRCRNLAGITLVNAVIKAFEGNLAPEFFEDIFRSVIPMTQGAIPPGIISPPGSQWQDKIARALPRVLEWSGLIYADVHMRKRARWEESWWSREHDFQKDPCVTESDYKRRFKTVVMWRRFGTLVTLEKSASMDLASLEPAQREAFNITDAMVSGQQPLLWEIRERVQVAPSSVGKKRKAKDS